MTTLALQGLAGLLAERMLNGLAEGIALALLAWVLLRVTGRLNSSTRFAVWFFTLLAVPVAPWLHGFGAGPNPAQASFSVPALIVPAAWATRLFMAWAAIAAVGLSRVMLGLWQLRKLRMRSSAIDVASLDPELRTAWEEFQPARAVKLAVSDELRVPTAIGFFRPMIVLPAWAMDELSGQELKSVLIHELAHLRRRDDWTNLTQKVLRAIFFFHPAVWWVERQLSLEREMACDDVVLARTANPRSYAQCLVTLAEKSFLRRGLALAQAAVSQMRQTSQRVAQILHGERSGATGVWKPAIGVVAAAMLVSVVGLSRTPELVAFQDRAPRAAVVGTAPHVIVASSKQTAKEATASAKPKPGVIPASRQPQPKVLPTAVQAKLTVPETAAPAINNTRAAADAAPPAVLVVFQTEQFGTPGMMRWTVYIWRVEVLDPSRIPTGPKVPAKSI